MSNNKQQTAVEWLESRITILEGLRDFGGISRVEYSEELTKVVQQAKEMEKEQISDAWENGFMSTGQGWNGEVTPEMHNETLDTEQYYEQTYGGKDE